MTIRRSEISDTRLPNELWLYIAELIPPDDWRYALCVNRILFDFVMDKWYSTIEMTAWRQTMDSMTRLRPPSIAAFYVRRLTITPDLETMYYDGSQSPDVALDIQSRHLTPLPLTFTKNKDALLWRSSYEHIVQTLIELMKNMEYLVGYTINVPWPCGETEKRELFDPLGVLRRIDLEHHGIRFLSVPLRSSMLSITKLDLRISLAHLQPLLSHARTSLFFLVLEDFSITLKTDNVLAEDRTYRIQLQNVLIPFLNRALPRTLCKLALNSPVDMDWSEFFESLHIFPVLQSLNLTFPLDALHFRDPSGFLNFLIQHAHTLTELTMDDDWSSSVSVSLLDEWIQRVFEVKQFTKLQTLDLQCIRGSFIPFVKYLHSDALPTITHLSLTGHRLSEDWVDDFKAALVDRSINPTRPHAFMRVLTKWLPTLNYLSLSFPIYGVDRSSMGTREALESRLTARLFNLDDNDLSRVTLSRLDSATTWNSFTLHLAKIWEIEWRTSYSDQTRSRDGDAVHGPALRFEMKTEF